MKLNKNRQQMYLDEKVGLINDGTVEQLREVTTRKSYLGACKYYALGYDSSKFPKEGIEHKPMSWFYEEESELPKVGEWWKCIKDVVYKGDIRFTKGKKYPCEEDSYLKDNSLEATLEIFGLIDYRSHFIKSTAPEQQPTLWKLNVDVPEWELVKGMIGTKSDRHYEFKHIGKLSSFLPISILQHIATPIYTTPFTLENGTTINLTTLDIQNIKKL